MTQDHPDFKAFMAVWQVWKKYHNPKGMTRQDFDDFAHEASAAAYAGSEDLGAELVKAISNTLDLRERNEKDGI